MNTDCETVWLKEAKNMHSFCSVLVYSCVQLLCTVVAV